MEDFSHKTGVFTRFFVIRLAHFNRTKLFVCKTFIKNGLFLPIKKQLVHVHIN